MGSEFFVLMPKYAHMYDSYKIFGAQPEVGVQGDTPKTARRKLSSSVILKRIIKIGTTPISFKRSPKNDKLPVVAEPVREFKSLNEFWSKK